MKTKPLIPILAQMYDKSTVKEYFKIVPGFFSSHEEKVRTDRLENELVLKIVAEKLPDTVLFNGIEMKLTKQI